VNSKYAKFSKVIYITILLSHIQEAGIINPNFPKSSPNQHLSRERGKRAKLRRKIRLQKILTFFT
jgi:hypothetical protein